MAVTAKISISIGDPELLTWARNRSKRTGMSLSGVFTEAIRFERQMEARDAFLTAAGPDGRATPGEMAAIRAEWGERGRRRPRADARPRPSVARSRAASTRTR